ncbi:UNVERIFIED_CONTAM: hypothetical protein GTU68_006285 [Idotea baltica]|nr:hypothetical protein [Idotea baltica]
MENAGRGCAEELLRRHALAHHKSALNVVILCGPGNNGGDGFVIARHLYNSGANVKVVLPAPIEKTKGDAKTMLSVIQQMKIPIQLQSELRHLVTLPTTWIVDAMLGTGAQGNLREPLAKVSQFSNSVPAKRMAIDIPTGLNADSGNADANSFRADVCCTFVARKPGFNQPAAQAILGDVCVIDIGATPDRTTWKP